MKSVLELRLNNSEGVLERVLGCLRQRGFELCSMQMQRNSDGSSLTIQCTVESLRPIENGCRHLAKLYDVQSIKLQYTEHAESYARNARSNEKSNEQACLSV
jgi:acetolactate synthase regulatory subunit